MLKSKNLKENASDFGLLSVYLLPGMSGVDLSLWNSQDFMLS
jgi:hypothetical protein